MWRKPKKKVQIHEKKTLDFLEKEETGTGRKKKSEPE